MNHRAFRIGQIVPSSNITMETEIPAMFRAREGVRPERFTFHSSRMRMHKVTKEELEAMNRESLRCAAELSDARVDVMSTACLVAIMATGLGYHRQAERELAEVARANAVHGPGDDVGRSPDSWAAHHGRQAHLLDGALHAAFDRSRRQVHRE